MNDAPLQYLNYSNQTAQSNRTPSPPTGQITVSVTLISPYGSDHTSQLTVTLQSPQSSVLRPHSCSHS